MFKATLSDKKCLLCETTETIEVDSKEPRFAGVVCIRHARQIIQPKEKPKEPAKV
jgi:hypothetical protein